MGIQIKITNDLSDLGIADYLRDYSNIIKNSGDHNNMPSYYNKDSYKLLIKLLEEINKEDDDKNKTKQQKIDLAELFPCGSFLGKKKLECTIGHYATQLINIRAEAQHLKDNKIPNTYIKMYGFVIKLIDKILSFNMLKLHGAIADPLNIEIPLHDIADVSNDLKNTLNNNENEPADNNELRF